MNRWKKFQKLRRQNDIVKLILLFGLAGTLCLGSVCYRGIELYHLMSGRAEYVLLVPGASQTSDISSKFQKLQELSKSGLSEEVKEPDILSMSLQQHKTVTVKYQGQNLPVSYVELSDEYVEKVYGISSDDSRNTIYLNQKAWEQFGTSKSELLLNCLRNEVSEKDKGLEKTARFVLITEQVPVDKPFIFSREEDIFPEKNADSIRVCFEGQDTGNGQVEALKGQGFEFENTEELVMAEQRKEIQQLKMKYEVVLGGICFLCMGLLRKYGKYSF